MICKDTSSQNLWPGVIKESIPLVYIIPIVQITNYIKKLLVQPVHLRELGTYFDRKNLISVQYVFNYRLLEKNFHVWLTHLRTQIQDRGNLLYVFVTKET